jgi:hypothetical protein
MTEDFDDDALPQVAASEAELVHLARALVAPHAYDAWLVLGKSRTLAPRIGPTCAMLVEDALRQIWPALWRRGARPGASLAGNEVVRGRGWERHAPARLEHTGATLQLVRWLVAQPLAAPPSTIDALSAAPLAIGDQVAIYLALAFAAGTPAQLAIARQPMVRAAPLAWLGFAHVMSGTPDDAPAAWDALATGVGAIVVEAIAGELASRWFAVELGKRAATDPAALVALGEAQDATLGAVMAACDRHRRRDLAGFVIDAARPLIARSLAPVPSALDPDATLAARLAARVAAGALLRAIGRWAAWDAQHRAVRFIDDDYAAAQLLLARFEPIGSAGAGRAAGWLAELSALAPTPGAEPATMPQPP